MSQESERELQLNPGNTLEARSLEKNPHSKGRTRKAIRKQRQSSKDGVVSVLKYCRRRTLRQKGGFNGVAWVEPRL